MIVRCDVLDDVMARDATVWPHRCQIASKCDPLFAAKNDPFDGAETGGAEPHIAEQSRSWRAAGGERGGMRGFFSASFRFRAPVCLKGGGTGRGWAGVVCRVREPP